MSRLHRLNIPGGIYHVMNRGNRKARIFEDDVDRRRFLRGVAEACEIYAVKVMGVSLIDNHFHLGLVTPLANLPEFMGYVQGEFAKFSNWRHVRVGHVFQGRYKAVVVYDDVHLFTVMSYLFMNPLKAGLATRPETHRWTTFAATVGLRARPEYLSLDWLTNLFGGDSRRAAQAELRRVMQDSKPLRAYLALRKRNRSLALRQYVDRERQAGEYAVALRPTLDEIHDQFSDEGMFAEVARFGHSYTISEIGKVLMLRPTTVRELLASRRRPR